LLSLLWIHGFMPSVDDTENYHPERKDLKHLKPVAGFFLTLAIIYGLVTICGLGIAFKLPARHEVSGGGSSFSQRLQMLKEPAAMALFTCAALSIAFLQAFMTSGVAIVADQAGASVAERGAVIFNSGIFMLFGRLIHGFGADTLRSHTPAKRAGPRIAAISAVSSTLVGFFILLFYQSWVAGTYFIGIGYGSTIALAVASARTTFGADLGLGLGVMFCIIGVMNFLYGLLGAALGYSAWFWCIGPTGSAITLLMFTGLAISEWGQ